MGISVDHELAHVTAQTFPISGQYFGSRLDDVRIMLVACERYAYSSMRQLNTMDDHWMLSFVQSGTVNVTCMGQSWVARSGDLMILPPHFLRDEIAEGAGVHEWMLIDAMIADRLDLFRFYPVAPVVKIQSPEKYSAKHAELNDMWHERRTEFWGLLTLSLTMQVLAMIFEDWRHAGSPARPAQMLGQVDRFTDLISYMNSHLNESLSRTDLAERLYLHPVYLDRAFRNAYGMSCMQMLRMMRLRKAKGLLETSDTTLDAIAEACGLSDASYLVRVFHKHYGITPHDYRKSFKSAING